MVNIGIIHSKLAVPLLPQLLQEIEFDPISIRSFQRRKPSAHRRASLHNEIVSSFIYFIRCDMLLSLFLCHFNLRFPTILGLCTSVCTIPKLLVPFKGAITIKHWQPKTTRVLIIGFGATFQHTVHSTSSFNFHMFDGFQPIVRHHIDCWWSSGVHDLWLFNLLFD